MSDEQKTKRASPRKRLILDLSKHLVVAEGRRPIRCLAVDVSRSGLGIVCFEALAPESEVILVLAEKGISLKVAWCKPDSVRQDVFHAGLGTSDLAVNIAKLLEAEGLLATEAGGGPPSPQEGSKPLAITFSSLCGALATAHTSDSGAFRTGQLSKLASAYNAYAINCHGASLYVLLPKDLKPIEASKLDDAAAAERRVIVLRSEGGKWRRVWPAE
jgi:hypothetical protein